MIHVSQNLTKSNCFGTMVLTHDIQTQKLRQQQTKRTKNLSVNQTAPHFRPYTQVLKSMKGYLNKSVVKSNQSTNNKTQQRTSSLLHNTVNENTHIRSIPSDNTSTAKRSSCRSSGKEENPSTIKKARQFLQKLQQASINIPEYRDQPEVKNTTKNTASRDKSREKKMSLLMTIQTQQLPITYMEIHKQKQKLKLLKNR